MPIPFASSQPIHPEAFSSREHWKEQPPCNARTAAASHWCSSAEELRKASREVLQPFSFSQILNHMDFFSSSSKWVSPHCFHGMKATMDKILKDSKVRMPKSSLGNILPETAVANGDVWRMGFASQYTKYRAAVEWQRETGSATPVQYRETDHCTSWLHRCTGQSLT